VRERERERAEEKESGRADEKRIEEDMSSEIVSAGDSSSSSGRTSAKSVQKRIVRTAKKLFASTGKAAWILSTTFLVLVVPLIIETDREQQLVELESQQMGVLTKK